MSNSGVFERSGIKILNPYNKLGELMARNNLSEAELLKLLEKIADRFAPNVSELPVDTEISDDYAEYDPEIMKLYLELKALDEREVNYRAIIIFEQIDDGIYVSFSNDDNKKDNVIRIVDLFPPNKADPEQNIIEIKTPHAIKSDKNSDNGRKLAAFLPADMKPEEYARENLVSVDCLFPQDQGNPECNSLEKSVKDAKKTDADMTISGFTPEEITPEEYASLERITLDENDIPPNNTKRFLRYLNKCFRFRTLADKHRAFEKNYFDIEIQKLTMCEAYVEFMLFIYPERATLELMLDNCFLPQTVYEIE